MSGKAAGTTVFREVEKLGDMMGLGISDYRRVLNKLQTPTSPTPVCVCVLLYMCVLLYVYVCVCMQKPEEDVGSLELELLAVVTFPKWALRTTLWSPEEEPVLLTASAAKALLQPRE